MIKRWNNYSTDAEQRLFDAIDEDDVADEHVSLPDVIDLSCTQKTIHENYAFCLQYWLDGFTRTELLRLVLKQASNQRLNNHERQQFKFIRSRYKHLRFALRLYTREHDVRYLFGKVTVYLGRFQDAFRNKNVEGIKHYGNLLKMHLSLPFWVMVRYSLCHVRLDNPAGFIAYRQQQMRELKQMLTKPELTGREFHSVRKIISQQVSYYDTLRAIDPYNKEACQMSRFMAAINGIMGDKHDELVADDLSGVRAYSTAAPLDSDLRQRLELLLARYPL